jgi:ABC-type transport system involved in multi-copper enzyme maturation permease subunit
MRVNGNYVVLFVSAIALFMCYFALLGVYHYTTDVDSSSRHEYLYLIGLAAIQGLFVLLVFVVLSYLFRNSINKIVFLVSTLPFIVLACSAVFAHLNGIPW